MYASREALDAWLAEQRQKASVQQRGAGLWPMLVQQQCDAENVNVPRMINQDQCGIALAVLVAKAVAQQARPG